MGRVACQEGHPRGKTFRTKNAQMVNNNEEMAPSPWQPLGGQGVQRISRLNRRAHNESDGGVVRVCAVNVGTLRGRRREVVDMLGRRRIDICCVQEVRYKGVGTTSVGEGQDRYKFWYSGNEDSTNGVGIFV